MTMAVRANDFTPRDFGAKTLNGDAAGYELRHIRVAFDDVVELKHADVRHSAVCAWILLEALQENFAKNGPPPLSRCLYLLQVQVASGAEVRTKALAAPVLGPLPPAAVESRQRELPVALSAHLGHEHMFAPWADG